MAPVSFQSALMCLCGWNDLVWINELLCMNQRIIVIAASGTKQTWAINSRQMREKWVNRKFTGVRELQAWVDVLCWVYFSFIALLWSFEITTVFSWDVGRTKCMWLISELFTLILKKQYVTNFLLLQLFFLGGGSLSYRVIIYIMNVME